MLLYVNWYVCKSANINNLLLMDAHCRNPYTTYISNHTFYWKNCKHPLTLSFLKFLNYIKLVLVVLLFLQQFSHVLLLSITKLSKYPAPLKHCPLHSFQQKQTKKYTLPPQRWLIRRLDFTYVYNKWHPWSLPKNSIFFFIEAFSTHPFPSVLSSSLSSKYHAPGPNLTTPIANIELPLHGLKIKAPFCNDVYNQHLYTR